MPAKIVIEVVSTGENAPSFGGESLLVLRAKTPLPMEDEETETNLDCVLPAGFKPMSIFPSPGGRDLATISEGVFSAPEGTEVGDKFFILGHYESVGPVYAYLPQEEEEEDP